jgi:type I restriction enzyme M protein
VTTQTELRNYVWQTCTAIRNEHRDVKKYVEYTAVLLFFKFYDDLYDTLPSDIQGLIPDKYRWHSLKSLDPRGFAGYHPEVLIRLRDFFENKRWKGKKTFGVIFDNFQFDIKHDEVLGRALLNLDRINFAGMAYDQKGDIYEYLIGRMADAGVKGEFFTPRPIVNTVIEILKPRFGLRVWDPACGTGGFLSRAFEEMLVDLKTRYSENSKKYQEGLENLRYNSIYGNETESVSARLARMNMILRGDGHSTILEFNSLDKQSYSQPRLEIRGQKQDNPIPGIMDQGGFDLIMANPPYGGSQAVSDVGSHSQFKPWQKSKKPEANFLQVMMYALKPGGRCGVLMPEGILFRREEKKIRERLLQDFHLEAVVGLFKGAFEFADVKACIVFFRKPTKAERWQGTKEIWIAEAKTFEDVQNIPIHFGKPVSDDLARIVPINEIQDMGLNLRPNKFLKNSSKDGSSVPLFPLGKILSENKDTVTISDNDEEYRRVSVALYGKGVTLRDVVRGDSIKAKRQQVVKAGQVIVSNIWARKQAFGIVPQMLDGALASTDFTLFDVISPDNEFDKNFLKYVLAYGSLADQLDTYAQGSTGKARVHPDDFLSLEIPKPPIDEQRNIVDRLKQQEVIRNDAERLLHGVNNLDWLDDAIFHVRDEEVLTNSFEQLVEDASNYIDPTVQPETEWKVYGVSNEIGVRLGEVKAGLKFKVGRRYKRLVKGALVFNPQRVNVGSVGIVGDSDDESIVSPYYVMFTCKPELDPKFALYLIKSPYFRRLINSPEGAAGAIRHELLFSIFTQIEVPIPIPELQRTIVQTIEKQLTAYAQVRMIRDQAELTMRKMVYGLFGQTEEKAAEGNKAFATIDYDEEYDENELSATIGKLN